MLSLLTALHSLPLQWGTVKGGSCSSRVRRFHSQRRTPTEWLLVLPPSSPMWSGALSFCALLSVLLFYVNATCPTIEPRAEEDERINGYHSATDQGHCATMLPTATSVFSISPALIVPSPALSPGLGVHLAWLTLANCTAVNQQLIPVESNTRWGKHCTTFIKEFCKLHLIIGEKAPSPSSFNS